MVCFFTSSAFLRRSSVRWWCDAMLLLFCYNFVVFVFSLLFLIFSYITTNATTKSTTINISNILCCVDLMQNLAIYSGKTHRNDRDKTRIIGWVFMLYSLSTLCAVIDRMGVNFVCFIRRIRIWTELLLLVNIQMKLNTKILVCFRGTIYLFLYSLYRERFYSIYKLEIYYTIHKLDERYGNWTMFTVTILLFGFYEISSKFLGVTEQYGSAEHKMSTASQISALSL